MGWLGFEMYALHSKMEADEREIAWGLRQTHDAKSPAERSLSFSPEYPFMTFFLLNITRSMDGWMIHNKIYNMHLENSYVEFSFYADLKK